MLFLCTEKRNLFNSTNVTREAYQNFLSGFQEEYPALFSTIQFDDIALDILNYVVSSREELRKSEKSVTYKFPIKMIPTFRDQSQICVSRNLHGWECLAGARWKLISGKIIYIY